jgi:hypothetical protein
MYSTQHSNYTDPSFWQDLHLKKFVFLKFFQFLGFKYFSLTDLGFFVITEKQCEDILYKSKRQPVDCIKSKSILKIYLKCKIRLRIVDFVFTE